MSAPPQEGRTAPPDLPEEIEEAIREWESSLMSACHDLAGAGAMRQADEDRRTLRSAIGRALAGERARADELRAVFMRGIQGQRESFERTRPLCSGHVDKMGGECLGCRIDRLERIRALAGAPPETAADEGAEEER